MIGRSGERESGISELAVRHDDDDIYIYIYRKLLSIKTSFIDFHATLSSHKLKIYAIKDILANEKLS